MNDFLPPGWNAQAQSYWKDGNHQAAIDVVLGSLNRQGQSKPLHLVLQLAYYIFLTGDPLGAARFLEEVRPSYPDDPDLLLNLSVCLSRGNNYAAALPHIEKLLHLQPDNVVALDAFCSCLFYTGRPAEAVVAGTRALQRKDTQSHQSDIHWKLPEGGPQVFASQPGKVDTIAFSLWGDNPRYLRGALENALQARTIYPSWKLRFYVDDTVPQAFLDTLKSQGAEVRMQAPGQSGFQRLAWRFQVASDPSVGRFLVRDVDSVINYREEVAVKAWIASDKWFHVMRDWWNHTDLMLAGMWGGVAQVLPAMAELMANYMPNLMDTPNVDQWFLRDVVWPYVRGSCMVHDRCFTPPGAQAWPEPSPPGNQHVGQNVYAVDRQGQAERLRVWIAQLPCLGESAPAVAVESRPSMGGETPASKRAGGAKAVKTKINIATPAYGSKYASVYLRTFYGLLTSASACNVEFSFSEIDYADVVTARNYLISNFYFNKPDHSHLLFIDDDMGFDPLLAYEMLDYGKDLVGVMAPRRQFIPANMLAQSNQPLDKAFALACEFVGVPVSAKERGAFVEVRQCGGGILLISRDCIRTMIEKCPEIVDERRFKKMPFGNQFKSFITPFNKIELEDKELSEDFSFCHRWVNMCGGKIFASTSKKIQHVGEFVVDTRYSQRWD